MASSIGRRAIGTASKFSFEEAVEEFFHEFPARRADTQIFDVSLPPDALRREVEERLSRLPRGFFPARMVESLLNGVGPSVTRYYDDEDGNIHETEVGDFGPPALCVMFAHSRAPADKSFAESLLKDYFLSKSSNAAYYRQRDFVKIPDEPAFRTDDYWLWHVFDHEAAHVLFKHEEAARPYGGRGINFEECVSDVYSLIRHYQRFGADTGFDRAMSLGRARLIPDMNDKYANAHMTVAAIEAARALDKGGLMNLSPRESFALAVATVEKSALSRKLLDEFADAAVETSQLQPVQMARFYARSGLPASVIGAYMDAALTLQKHEGLETVAIETARAKLGSRPLVLSLT